MGKSQTTLPRPCEIVAHGRRKQLAFTGQVLGGNEVCQGLVTRGGRPRAAMSMAREIAGSHRTLRAAKQLFETAWHADAKTGLELEAELQGY